MNDEEEAKGAARSTIHRMNAMADASDDDSDAIWLALSEFVLDARKILSQEEPEWVAMADNFTRVEEVLQPRLNAFSLLALIERMKSSEAVDRAIKGHLKHHRARKFVEAEWGKHKHAYKGNKSAFSRVYARRVKNELGVDITEKQMREVWLVDTLFADKPDGLP